MEDAYLQERQEFPKEESSYAWVFVLVIVVIIAVVVFYLWYTGAFITPTNINQWKFTNGTTGTSDTFVGANWNAYIVSQSTTGTITVTIQAPANATGQQFAIAHGSTSTVVLTSPNGSSYTLNPRTGGTFVWISQSEYVAI